MAPLLPAHMLTHVHMCGVSRAAFSNQSQYRVGKMLNPKCAHKSLHECTRQVITSPRSDPVKSFSVLKVSAYSWSRTSLSTCFHIPCEHIHFRTAHPRTFKHGPTGNGHVCPRFSSGTLSLCYDILVQPFERARRPRRSCPELQTTQELCRRSSAIPPRHVTKTNSTVKTQS